MGLNTSTPSLRASADELDVAFACGLEAHGAFVERSPQRRQPVLGEVLGADVERCGDQLERGHGGAVASGDEVREVPGADPGAGRVELARSSRERAVRDTPYLHERGKGIAERRGTVGRKIQHRRGLVEPPAVFLEVMFELAYEPRENGAEFDPDDIEHFTFVNATFNAWPYWRELAQSMTQRMGIPPVVVPVLKIPSPHDPE